MPNGFGFGRGGRGWGMGYGFRGASPPWPYVGLGRGGLPRHAYFVSGAAGVPMAWPYQQAPYPDYSGVAPFGAGQAPYPHYGAPWDTPYYGAAAAPGAMPYAPQMTREQEIDFLKQDADAVKGQLDEIEARIRELEKEE